MAVEFPGLLSVALIAVQFIFRLVDWNYLEFNIFQPVVKQYLFIENIIRKTKTVFLVTIGPS